MSKDEAHQLAVAYDEVARHYPILQMPANVAALVNFAQAVGLAYGPRFMAMRLRLWNTQRQTRTPQTPPRNNPPTDARSTVQQFSHDPPPGTPTMQKNGNVSGLPEGPKNIPEEIRTSHIAGIGDVIFPPDHELFGGKKPN